MQDLDARHRFIEFGVEPTSSTPEALAKFIASKQVRWREVITRANIPVGKM